MNRLTLTFALILTAGHFLPAQSLTPENLRSQEEHVAFFDTVFQLHQELVRRSGPVIRKYGWESAEHLALRDSTLERNAHLRNVVNRYLDQHGFPVPSQELLKKRKLAQTDLMSRMKKTMWLDSIARDSVMNLIAQSYGNDIRLRDTWPTVMLILDTEPDFSKRCDNITWLRFEWEEGNLSTQKMLAYLRHTYAAKHGIELDIATGSTERERIFMHARELSGCWGN